MHDSIAKLEELLNANCKIERVHPAVLASDAEVNIVIVELVCPDGETHTIKAYRDEALVVREFIRSLKNASYQRP
jgi:hypothetical protein